MPVKITIRYPKESPRLSGETLSILKKFEQALCSEMVQVMCSTADYHWRHEPDLESDVYFTLVKNHKSIAVVTVGLRSLSNMSPDELIEKIRTEQIFPDSKPSP